MIKINNQITSGKSDQPTQTEALAKPESFSWPSQQPVIRNYVSLFIAIDIHIDILINDRNRDG